MAQQKRRTPTRAKKKPVEKSPSDVMQTPESIMGNTIESDSIESVDNQPSIVDFDALDAMAAQAATNGKQTPRQQSHMDDEGGDAYVRMINTTGHCIAVSCRLVPDRFMDGYQFIVGEPTVPIMKTKIGGHPDMPDAAQEDPNYVPQARATASANMHRDAMQIWISEMRKDLTTYRTRSDLHWDFVRQLGEAIAGARTE